MYPSPTPVQYNPNISGDGQQPIIIQPSGGPGAPQQTSGLQAFYGADKIIVKQKKEMLEIFTGWETNNRYEVFNGAGQLIFYAFEDSSTLSRLCLGEHRPFCIRVIDFQRQEVMVVNSSVSCCTRDVTIEVPPGRLAADIRQEFAFFTPSFYATNPAGQLMFKVKSPATAAFGSFGNVNFDVFSSDQRTQVGQITKQWGGLMREWMTDADTFGVSVPADMDVTWKAILLGLTFIVDFQFYQKSQQR